MYESNGNVQGGHPENQPGADSAERLGSGQHPCGRGRLRGLRGLHLQLLRLQDRAGKRGRGKHLERHLPPPGGRSRVSGHPVLHPMDVPADGIRLPAVSRLFTHHALGFVRQDTANGKQQMRQTWQHILDALCNVLRHDTKIRPGAFTEQFTPEQFAGILFSLMLSAVVQQNFDPSAVLEIVRRTIY